MSTFAQQNSPSPSKQSRYSRKRCSGELFIEELSPDDMGYDADIETIKPDKYEEPESESEGVITPSKSWKDIDEELSARMRQLGREQLTPLRSSSNRGRKRRSVEMTDGDMLLGSPCTADIIEIQELVDNAAPSPAKRRRRKSRRPNAAHHTLRGQNDTWTDSSGRGDSNGKMFLGPSTTSTASEQAPPRKNDDDEMMDVA